MKKQLAKVYLNDDGTNLTLSVKTADGKERFVNIFDGSGYYSAIWLRTQKEIDDSIKARKEADKKDRERYVEREKEEAKKKWYQIWRAK